MQLPPDNPLKRKVRYPLGDQRLLYADPLERHFVLNRTLHECIPVSSLAPNTRAVLPGLVTISDLLLPPSPGPLLWFRNFLITRALCLGLGLAALLLILYATDNVAQKVPLLVRLNHVLEH